MSNKVYTYSEAREKLGGMATSTFSRLVNSGKIRKIVPPGKKQGVYLREDVDTLADAMNTYLDIYLERRQIEVVEAKTESDIKATVQIARQHFGERAYSLERRMAWFRTEPEGDYVLKDRGVIVGYFSMKPVSKEAVQDHILTANGGVRNEDIERFIPGKDLECYILGIATKLTVDGDLDKRYGAALITGVFDKMLELGKRGINITKIWSTSRTVTGIKLSSDLGFENLGYLDNEHIALVLDTRKASHPLMRHYRKVVDEALKDLNKKRA